MGYNKNMDNDDYIRINEEGLAEINPTASSDAQMAFIDAYRAAQGENTAQIGEQAHALGSDLEAQYGGLHGPSEYWKSRYQTPQTESRVAGLRSAAQLSALNNLMQNDLANWKNRYSNAYKAAQKRASSGSGGGGTPTTTDTTTGEPDIVTNVLDEYDVVEDAFFKQAEQQRLYDALMQKQAKARGMTVEEYTNYLNQQNQIRQGAAPASASGGIGAYNFSTGTFNNGLGV